MHCPQCGYDGSGATTMRQRQVYALMKQGKKSPQIAEVLGIAVKTVHAHIYELHKRVGYKGNPADRKAFLKAVERGETYPL